MENACSKDVSWSMISLEGIAGTFLLTYYHGSGKWKKW